MMFTLDDYESYFEASAGEGKPCQTLYHIDMFDQKITDDLKGYSGGRALVLFAHEIIPAGDTSDNVWDNYQGALMVIEKYTVKGEDRETERKRIRNECLSALMKIRSAMYLMHDQTALCHFLKGLDKSSCKINKVGPLFNGMYGWMMEFDIMQAFEPVI